MLTRRYAGRPGWPAEFKPWVQGNDTVVLHPDRLEAPLRWRTPRRVFVDSMSDLFHEAIPDEFIDKVFAVMALTPQHTYQVLTKRPERMRAYMSRAYVPVLTAIRRIERSRDVGMKDEVQALHWPLPGIWLGVTVENQRWADHRIPILLDTPAAVRFVSAEPLLGPVQLGGASDGDCTATGRPYLIGSVQHYGHEGMVAERRWPGLDWVIVGGESGPKHRPFNPDWARSIVSQCRDAGVACFVKQLGGARPGNSLEYLPPDLRVREYPA